MKRTAANITASIIVIVALGPFYAIARSVEILNGWIKSLEWPHRVIDLAERIQCWGHQ